MEADVHDVLDEAHVLRTHVRAVSPQSFRQLVAVLCFLHEAASIFAAEEQTGQHGLHDEWDERGGHMAGRDVFRPDAFRTRAEREADIRVCFVRMKRCLSWKDVQITEYRCRPVHVRGLWLEHGRVIWDPEKEQRVQEALRRADTLVQASRDEWGQTPPRIALGYSLCSGVLCSYEQFAARARLLEAIRDAALQENAHPAGYPPSKTYTYAQAKERMEQVRMMYLYTIVRAVWRYGAKNNYK